MSEERSENSMASLEKQWDLEDLIRELHQKVSELKYELTTKNDEVADLSNQTDTLSAYISSQRSQYMQLQELYQREVKKNKDLVNNNLKLSQKYQRLRESPLLPRGYQALSKAQIGLAIETSPRSDGTTATHKQGFFAMPPQQGQPLTSPALTEQNNLSADGSRELNQNNC